MLPKIDLKVTAKLCVSTKKSKKSRKASRIELVSSLLKSQNWTGSAALLTVVAF